MLFDLVQRRFGDLISAQQSNPAFRPFCRGCPCPTPRKKRLRKEALEYHEAEPQGKINRSHQPHSTAHELGWLTPGVAYPVWRLRTSKTPTDTLRRVTRCGDFQRYRRVGSWQHWGLGQQTRDGRQRLASKTFAGIDVFDIEVDTEDPRIHQHRREHFKDLRGHQP